MTEGELEHHPFEVGIDGILIELGRRNRGGERRRGEFEAVALDSDRRSDEAFPIERHTVRLAHRPVLRGGEFQLTVPEPAPGPGDTGGDVDTGLHYLAHALQRRDGRLEHHVERIGLRVVDGEDGGGRCGEAEVRPHCPGAMAPHQHAGPERDQTHGGGDRVAPECAWIGRGAGAQGCCTGAQ